MRDAFPCPAPLRRPGSPRISSRNVVQLSIPMGTGALRSRAHLVARSWRALDGQRAAHRAVSPPGAAVERGQAGGYRACPADRAYALARAGNPAVRIQHDGAAHQRAADPRAHGPDRKRRRPGSRAESYPLAGELGQQQSQHVHLSDCRGQIRQGHHRITRKFPGRPGSLRRQGAAAGV